MEGELRRRKQELRGLLVREEIEVDLQWNRRFSNLDRHPSLAVLPLPFALFALKPSTMDLRDRSGCDWFSRKLVEGLVWMYAKLFPEDLRSR